MLKHIRRAEDALDQVNPRTNVDLDDLYAMGGALTASLGYLADAVRLGMQTSVENLRTGPIYDDTEHGAFLRTDGPAVDPLVRLSEANEHLAAFHRHLMAAREDISRYHSAIGHIGIRGER